MTIGYHTRLISIIINPVNRFNKLPELEHLADSPDNDKYPGATTLNY